MEIPHGADTDICLYQGGVGSGKTTAGVLLGLMLAYTFPKSRGLVGARDYTLLRDTTRVKWEELVPGRLIESWSKDPDNLRLVNGSEIRFRHLSDPGRLLSSEFNWAHVEEASQITHKLFMILLSRLRYDIPGEAGAPKPVNRLFLTGNPEEDPGWLYEVFQDPEAPENVRFIQASTRENRFLLERQPEFVRMLENQFDEQSREVYIEGKTGHAQGQRVYAGFDRQKHLDRELSYRDDLPLHLSFDFNVDFMYCLVAQQWPQGVTALLDEVVLRGGCDTNDLCRAVLGNPTVAHHHGPVEVHGDASGYSRSHRGLESDYGTIRRWLSGYSQLTIHPVSGRANPPVKERTAAVRLSLQEIGRAPVMRVHPRCKALIKSLELTRWLQGTWRKQKVADPADRRFEIDHPGDALDYFIADRESASRRRVTIHGGF